MQTYKDCRISSFAILPSPGSAPHFHRGLLAKFTNRKGIVTRSRVLAKACRELKGPAGPPGPPPNGDGGDGDGHGDRSLEDRRHPYQEAKDGADDVIILDITGMHCGGCASRVRRILQEHPNVTQANVNLTTEVALVHVHLPALLLVINGKENKTYDLQAIAEQLMQTLSQNGFKAGLRDKNQSNAAAAAIVRSRREERLSR